MEETVRTLLQNQDSLEGPKVDPLDLMKAYKVPGLEPVSKTENQQKNSLMRSCDVIEDCNKKICEEWIFLLQRRSVKLQIGLFTVAQELSNLSFTIDPSGVMHGLKPSGLCDSSVSWSQK